MTIKNLFYKNTELMVLSCLIIIAFAIYYFLITIEPFSSNYIPQSKRGYQEKKIIPKGPIIYNIPLYQIIMNT